MKKLILNIALMAATVCAGSANAQNPANESKKVKVVIKENKDGKETVFEADELTDDVKKKLKESGIDLDDLESRKGDGRKVYFKNDISTDNGETKSSNVMIRIGDPNDPEFKKMLEDRQTQVITRDGETKIIMDGKELRTSATASAGDRKVVKVFVRTIDVTDANYSECRKAGIARSKDQLSLETINCTPNPSTGKFILKFSSPDKSSAEISVRNINGKVVYTESVKDFNGNYEKEVDLDKEAKGIYFVTITQGKKAITKKMVIE